MRVKNFEDEQGIKWKFVSCAVEPERTQIIYYDRYMYEKICCYWYIYQLKIILRKKKKW